MTSPLDNLLKVSKGGLKQEAPSQSEFDGLVRSAKRKRKDAAISGLGQESRFDLAYNAAHALALAALRWHGYRSENRILVFQALAQRRPYREALAAADIIVILQEQVDIGRLDG